MCPLKTEGASLSKSRRRRDRFAEYECLQPIPEVVIVVMTCPVSRDAGEEATRNYSSPEGLCRAEGWRQRRRGRGVSERKRQQE